MHAENITQSVAFLSSEVTVWGVPGDARHDGARGYGCLGAAHGASFPGFSCNPLEGHSPPSFLALPTSCPRNPATGQPEPLQTSVEGDSWLEPKPTGQQPLLASFLMPALDGCNRLPFTPSIRVTPDSEEASRPTGLKVDVHVPPGRERERGRPVRGGRRGPSPSRCPRASRSTPRAATAYRRAQRASSGSRTTKGSA